MFLRITAIAVLLLVVCPGVRAEDGLANNPELSLLPPVTEELPAPAAPLATPSEANPAETPSTAGPTLPPSVLEDLTAAEAEAPTSEFAFWTPGWQVWEPSFWDPWDGSVELGLNGTEGNTQTFNVRFGMTAKHKTEHLVQSLQITSIQKSANGLTTANTALADGRIEFPMPNSRWNYFIHGLLEYDEFKPFDMRISADTGFGYEFIQTDLTTLIGRSGLATSREVNGPDDDIEPELLFGTEFKHRFNEFHSISFKTEYYPSVQNFSDYRLNSQAAWEIAIWKAWGLSLKLSAIDRYDSTPQGAKPNDLDYSTLLLWSF